MARKGKSTEEIIAALREAEVRIAQGGDSGQDLPRLRDYALLEAGGICRSVEQTVQLTGRHRTMAEIAREQPALIRLD